MLLDNINYIFITDNSKALKDIPMKERKKILAFDIGGTKIAYALIDEKGKICGEITKVSTPRDSREILTTLKSVVSGFEDVIYAVAVATAGEVSKNNDRIIASVGNMPKDYMNTPFKELSEKPVVVENDANAAMWAEYRLGAAKGMKDAMLVAIGTGVGISFVVNGQLLKGKSGAAGEAHFKVARGNKRRCGCGAYDCYEIYASGTALGIDAKEAYGDDTVTSHDVIRGLKENNPLAVKVFDEWERDVVNGIIGLANIFDPEIVVLFGSLTEFMDYCKLEKMVNREILTMPVKLCRAKFENNAAMIGAALIAADKLKKGKK